jgi:hypothetical protein
MESIGRLLLRFLLVPLGYFIAVLAGTLVILVGSWKIWGAQSFDMDTRAIALYGYVFASPVLLFMLLSVMWLPAAIGVLISETFAIRSWMFHAANGAVCAWVAWGLFGYADDSHLPLNEPLAIIAAGLAGGFAYWAVAGWSAGFWKPVFTPERARAPAEAASPPPQIR